LAGLGSDVRNRRRLAAASVSVAAVLVVAGTHAVLSAAGSDGPADLEAAGRNTDPQWFFPQSGDPWPTAATASAPARPRAEGPAATPPVSSSPIHQQTKPNQPPQPTRPSRLIPPPRTPDPTRTAAAPKPPAQNTPPPGAKAPSDKPTPTSPTSTTTPPAQPPITTGTGSLTGIAGQCLAVDDSNGADGAAVQIFGCNGGDTQVWTVQGGTLQALGRCLQPSGDGAGSQLELHSCDDGSAQHWQLSAGAIVNPGSELCLAVPGDAADDGTAVVTAVCADDPGQAWKLS
jgi:hypothetical protein